MIRTTLATSALALSVGTASAGGLDRSGQPIGILFEKGNYAEYSLSYSKPSVTGVDVLTNQIGNVGQSFTNLSGGIKFDVSDKLSFALIADEPFGSDVSYPGAANTMLGGTAAYADSFSMTAIGRYKFTERFSAHAGLRYQTLSGNITLSGLSYAGLNGYNVDLDSDSGVGFLVGAAYEIPEIALRVAVTYNSSIKHSLATRETLNGAAVFGASANTEIESPESLNIDFQTGLNTETLLFGSIRYARWSDLRISPTGFDGSVNPATPGDSISDLEDSLNLSLGLGRKFTDNFSGTIAFGYERKGSDDLVSPLSPANGNMSIGIGGRYTMDNVTLSGGIRYTKIGDARPETGTPDVARASFTNNSAISVGMKVGFTF